MSKHQGRYSIYLKPAFFTIDLIIINFLIYLFPLNFSYALLFEGYISLAWIIIAVRNNFYEVHRYSKATLIANLMFTQFVFFFLALYAYIGFFKEPNMSRKALVGYFAAVFFLIFFLKILFYFLLRIYRVNFSGNSRTVVVIGKNKKTDQLIELFHLRPDFGYRFKRQFDVSEKGFTLQKALRYIAEEEIEEIYCSVGELKNRELSEIIDFADNNLKVVKFLPDNKQIYTKKLKYEYYDYIPILSLRDIPLEHSVNAFIKRVFDLVFSSLVIVFILSWLTPLIALLIRLESQGPIFFRQKRNGIDNREFACYKFRSMAVNESADKQMATKNDMRVTKIGKFIRRTSIDELPQFFNVFGGSMSVVGPRPHMVSHTNSYSERIDKYMVRHFVKPGITGLAQIRGFRGEIENDSDIINRVKLDIFYVENWSVFLDFKIIIQTVVNALRGEEKAY